MIIKLEKETGWLNGQTTTKYVLRLLIVKKKHIKNMKMSKQIM